MKRIITAVIIVISVFVLSGCNRNYDAITYTKFNEIFKEKKDYNIINQTLKYEDRFERCLEASGKNIQFLYYEFKTEEEARNYISDNYKNRKKYKFKDKKNSIIVKCTNKMYFYAVQVDKIVIVGDSPIKKNKKEIKKIFKELGY